MNNSCIFIPTIKVGNQEVISQLFTELVDYTGDRQIAKEVWAATQVKEFINSLPNLKFDNNGEPTLESLINAINLDEKLPNGISLNGAKKKLNAISKNGKPVVHKDVKSVLNNIINFNNSYDKYVANYHFIGNGYAIDVSPKTSENMHIPEEVVFENTLNNNLLNILHRIGFDIQFLEGVENTAIFNPKNARKNAEGLISIIQLSRDKFGEESLPEEFSHLMIEGLINHPLVKRLVDSFNNNEVIKQILGNSYESYVEKYNGNQRLLQKEAAGKLLSEFINGKQIKEKTSLLERLWNYIKGLFSKTSINEINDAINKAEQEAYKVAKGILDESLLSFIDRNKIIKGDTLYNLNNRVGTLEKLANSSLEIMSKRLEIIRSRTKSSIYDNTDYKEIKEVEKLIEQKKYTASCASFLKSSLRLISGLNDKIKSLYNIKDLDKLNSYEFKNLCATLRNIKEFSIAYEPIVKQLMSLQALKDSGEIEISDEDAQSLMTEAGKVFGMINNINSNYKNMRFNVLYKFLKTYWGEDKIVDIGKNKGDRITLEMIMKQGMKDINFLDRYISSMSDASDPLLSLIDKVVKTTQNTRDEKLEEILVSVRAAHTKLSKSGYTTDFMYERDENGIPTGYLISDRNFSAYDKARQEYIETLKEKGYEYRVFKSMLESWERRNTDTIVLDPDLMKTERVPRKDLYPSNALDNLSSEQREYYNSMIKLKKMLDSLLPQRYTHTYKAVQIRNDITESVINNITNPKEASKLILSNLKDNFVRRSDDSDWGDTTLFEEDDNGIKNVKLDFLGNPIQKLPIYFTNRLKNMNRLSTDFTASIMAYAGMAVNYNEMNRVIDALELARDFVLDREIQQSSGDLVLQELYKVLGKEYKKTYTKVGADTSVGERLNDYYSSVIYGEKKIDEGTWNGVDKSKVVDAIKSYTGALGLGFNLFAGISNITMGKLQLLIEGTSSEYYGPKSLAWSIKEFYKLLPQYLGELNATNKTNKLALFIDKFDALEDFYNNLRTTGYYKGAVSRIMGSTNIFILNHIGEIYLHTRNMLAFLDSTKVLDANNNEISLYNALNIETDENNVSRVVIQEGVKDLDGNLLSIKGLEKYSKEYQETEERYNKYISDIKLKIGKISQSMNGAFNDVDRGAINRYSLGRLALQFRQWMPAHYYRRFASTYYDARLDEHREGYYRTLGRFMLETMKDLRHLKFQLATNWSKLSSKEKSNIGRALTELISFGVLSLLISLLGPEKDRKGSWGKRMLSYQLRRLYLETGASIPWISLVKNAKTIIQSPAAAINSVDGLIDVLCIWNMNDEIQSGRYKGWSVWERDVTQAIPLYSQISRTRDLANEDYMFAVFNK